MFLPLHAASDGKQSTMQYVISSYTPNLTALIAARKAQTASIGHPKLCVVCQPNVQGEKPLPEAQEEVGKIYSVVPSQSLVRINGDILQGNAIQIVIEDIQNTTAQKVLDRIRDVSIQVVHFACHGTQNTKAPLQSALLLHDGPLTVSQIRSVHRDVPASLAFLSACRSGMGDIHQPDEAIHMAAAMLTAGFRSVVATMW
jgi:CHAT domain-containing protein